MTNPSGGQPPAAGRTDRLHLSPRHRKKLEALLREHLPGIEVWAYGSRVNGESHDGSDLDLVLRAPGLQEVPISPLADFTEALHDSTLPFLVEARDWTRLPERFHREIERGYVVVQEKTKQTTTAEWREATLGDCVVMNESTYSLKESWPFINYLDTGNITDNRVSKIQHLIPDIDKIPSRARRKIRDGDIVYSTVRPNQRHFGLLRETPENCLASTGFAVIRGKKHIADTGFIFWFLTQNHIVEHLHTIGEHSTSAYPSIRPSDIKQLKLRLPTLDEQRAIAHILGTLDDKIELNRRMNETLEAMARALFKSWFVDFEPVRAKMEGHWRPGESLPGLPAHLYDLFPDRLVESELGEAPEGWEVGTLGNIANAPRRGVHPEDMPIETPYIGLEHMPRRSIALVEWDNARKIKSSKSIFEKGDILFGKLRPYFHKVGIAPVQGICSTDIVVVVPKSAEWLAFTLACVSSIEFVNYTNQTATGTKMPRTSWKTMSRYPVCLPPTPVTQAFQNVAKAILEHIVTNIHEVRKLVAIRDVLLPKLISGELRINDRKHLVERAF